jgi:hypothetical protein
MTDIIIGTILSLIIIGFLEIFKQFDKKLIATITLVGISFIYLGFSWINITYLAVASIGVLIFTLLAYYGYKKDFRLIVLGLFLHSFWDLFCHFNDFPIPTGYDKFCITVDWILAIYFYIRLKNYHP